jgi:hypothetical protein
VAAIAQMYSNRSGAGELQAASFSTSRMNSASDAMLDTCGVKQSKALLKGTSYMQCRMNSASDATLQHLQFNAPLHYVTLHDITSQYMHHSTRVTLIKSKHEAHMGKAGLEVGGGHCTDVQHMQC